MCETQRELAGNDSNSARRPRAGAVQPVIAISLIVVGAFLSVGTPRGQISVGATRLGENDRVSARARATVELIGPNGRIIDSKVFPSLKVGYGAVDSSRLQARLVPASYFGVEGPRGNRLVASGSPSATEGAILANPLRSVADIAVSTENSNGAVVLGPTGRDSALTINDGHTSLNVRYGRPGEPDTLRTFVQDGRLVETVHTSWASIRGGRIMRTVEYDTPFADGTRLHVHADLDRYVFTSPARAPAAMRGRAGAAIALSSNCFTTSLVTTYGFSYSVRYCGSGPHYNPACGPAAAACQQDDYNMNRALVAWDNCVAADSGAYVCNTDSSVYEYYRAIDSTAYAYYFSLGCPAF